MKGLQAVCFLILPSSLDACTHSGDPPLPQHAADGYFANGVAWHPQETAVAYTAEVL